ncbi:Trm112 family protein [Aestuariibacter sp. AA17]|uniref:UPF0434 protein OE749_04295 n=1 Tax=Fluctibacter corallii TaxID=2984329 RepID=A0ABT3A5J7_9ALTE|nr:Trm112 family protein [Aestuariibacter sp. AA17]MCV2883910.1 Trm112 family protein [Aestuariibacter sp. AA17]
MAFDTKLLDIIACPACKGKLHYVKAKQVLVCRFDRLVYAIKDDIPVMLENEATEITSEELDSLSDK